MPLFNAFASGKGANNRQSHHPLIDPTIPAAPSTATAAAATAPSPAAASSAAAGFPVQATSLQLPHYPFQKLPTPKDPAPYRYDLSRLLTSDDIKTITDAGVMVFHTVGDTGDSRGQQKDFVSKMMADDSDNSADNRKPAFFYHLGDVVYFAGDVNMYGDNFYEVYKEYPGFIVSIPGNHDCQPDDPQDGPVDPNKFPLDGWVQNFMSKTPNLLGSRKTGSGRTQMDLPNVFWTFNTPLATIIGLFSNVGETQAEIHQDQIDWFRGELAAADPELALIVAVHHPPFSGDTEHSGSSAVYKVLFDSFQAKNRYPNLILSGHVHNYQRFTNIVQTPGGKIQVPCIVAGAGGYKNLGKLHNINGKNPTAPLKLGSTLTLEQYDQKNFGFLRLEVTKKKITGKYSSAPYVAGGDPKTKVVESFEVNLAKQTVKTL